MSFDHKAISGTALLSSAFHSCVQDRRFDTRHRESAGTPHVIRTRALERANHYLYVIAYRP